MKLNLLAQKVYSFCLEYYLGIDTTGSAPAAMKWGVGYAALPYHVVRRILDHLSMKPDDVFVDIGCGKGRVVCCASRVVLRKVVAIEVNKALLEVAVANSNKLRDRRSPVEALAIPAEDYDFADATVIYLYNPFDRPTMDKVFARVDESFRRNPRPLRVVYANPKHEAPLERLGWLVKREEWPASDFPGWGCAISVWSSEVRG